MTERSDQHIGVLDGLRAMAIMLVLCTHGLDLVWLDMSKPYLALGGFDFAPFFKNGLLGVDLFFVLSGFLITGQLLDGGLENPEGRWQGVRRYLRRRACRIMPAYYLVLTFCTVALMFFDPLKRGADQWALSYVPHLLFLQNYFYATYNPVFWSLAVEMQFYLLAPFLLLGLLKISSPRMRQCAAAGLILLLAAARTALVMRWQPESPDYNSWFFNIRALLPFSLDSILAGMLCNLLWRDERTRAILSRKPVANILFFGGLLLFLVLAGLRPPLEAGIGLFGKTFYLTFIAAAFSAMLLGLMGGSAGHGLFESRPFRHIAFVSYSMYLIHLSLIKDIFNIAQGLTRPLNCHLATYLTGMVLLTGITVALATLMYRYVEKPFIDWAKKKPASSGNS